MAVLIDSFAWFEYFFGSAKGKKVKEVLDSGNRIIISSLNLFEVYSKYLRDAKNEAEEKKNFMLNRAELIEVTKDIAVLAAKIKTEHKMGLADAVVLATARQEKATVLTGDDDFKDFKDVQLI